MHRRDICHLFTETEALVCFVDPRPSMFPRLPDVSQYLLIGSRYLRMHGMCFTYLLSGLHSSFRFEKKVGILGFLWSLVVIFTQILS